MARSVIPAVSGCAPLGAHAALGAPMTRTWTYSTRQASTGVWIAVAVAAGAPAFGAQGATEAASLARVRAEVAAWEAAFPSDA